MSKPDITAERLRELLSYDPVSGVFTNRVSRRKAKAGAAAGRPNKIIGYVEIRLDMKLYHAHRLAVLYMTGRLPEGYTDHKDGNRANNAWENLRECDASQNGANSCKKKRNGTASSELKGVYLSKGKWVAQISTGRKNFYLGRFVSEHEAHAAYAAAAKAMFGEYARA